MSKLETLAEFLEVGTDEITKSEYYDNGFSYGNQEYLVLTDEEADKKVADEIRETLWAFNPSFILDHSVIAENYNDKVSIALGKMLVELCEGANELVFAIIEDIDDFVEDAVMSDGRGHFLADYDGYEHEQGNYYIYRVD